MVDSLGHRHVPDAVPVDVPGVVDLDAPDEADVTTTIVMTTQSLADMVVVADAAVNAAFADVNKS
jgi:hypothetical protein